MKRIIITGVSIIIILTITSLIGIKKPNIEEVLMEAMNSDIIIKDENNNSVYFKDYRVEGDTKAVAKEYTYIDLDNDHKNELVVLTNAYSGEYVILRYFNKKVYGYLLGARSFLELKEDGSFSRSGSAFLTTVSRMEFQNNRLVINDIAIYDSENKKYTVNNQDVSEKEIKKFMEDWGKKKNQEFIEVKTN